MELRSRNHIYILELQPRFCVAQPPYCTVIIEHYTNTIDRWSADYVSCQSKSYISDTQVQDCLTRNPWASHVHASLQKFSQSCLWWVCKANGVWLWTVTSVAIVLTGWHVGCRVLAAELLWCGGKGSRIIKLAYWIIAKSIVKSVSGELALTESL